PAGRRGNVGVSRSSDRARQAGARGRRSRQHLCRSRDALGQFRQERPLRADQLVQPIAARSKLNAAAVLSTRGEIVPTGASTVIGLRALRSRAALAMAGVLAITGLRLLWLV